MSSHGNEKETTDVQCVHCGRWFLIGRKNIRAMNYCFECVD